MQRNLIFAPAYNTKLSDFGVDKPFALDRGELVLKQLGEDLGQTVPYSKPEPLTDDDILLVHTKDYLQSLSKPQTWLDIFEFDSSEYHPETAKKTLPQLLSDFKLKSGGTLLAARNALELGLAANLGAGYHHAFPDRGRGYCVIHDVAITIRKLMKEGLVKKAMVVDLDFHQGDGTALIFENDPQVFTLSVHSEEGWPEEKQKSDLDVPIFSGEEALYQKKTEAAIKHALSVFSPDICIYVAGTDPYEKDVLPGSRFINLSLEQMKKRDAFIIDSFADRGIPLVSVFAGGYGPHVWEVHYWATRRLLERSGVKFGGTVACG